MVKGSILTIAICSYNRADFLRLALQSLCKQTAKSSDFEILIIDNNSTDNTKNVSQEFETQLSNLRYISETRQGLSFARNRSYIEANGDYIGYLDDDAQANENWVDQALSIIDMHSPDVFGGPIYPYYLSPKPDWFKDEFEIRIHCKESGFIKDKGSISGSNMFFRKDVLHELGGFNPNFGMVGNKLQYGEENELLERAKASGKSVYYDLELTVKHYVPDYKMSLLYLAHKYLESGKANFKINQQSFEQFRRKDNINLLNEYYRIFGDIIERINLNTEKLKKGDKKINPEFVFADILKKLYHLAAVQEEVHIKYNQKESFISMLKRRVHVKLRQLFHMRK